MQKKIIVPRFRSGINKGQLTGAKLLEAVLPVVHWLKSNTMRVLHSFGQTLQKKTILF
jgi:hypothetical protein